MRIILKGEIVRLADFLQKLINLGSGAHEIGSKTISIGSWIETKKVCNVIIQNVNNNEKGFRRLHLRLKLMSLWKGSSSDIPTCV